MRSARQASYTGVDERFAQLLQRPARELVEGAGLTTAVEPTIFDRGLGPAAACSESSRKAFLASPDDPRFQLLADELLAYAQAQFAKVKPAPCLALAVLRLSRAGTAT